MFCRGDPENATIGARDMADKGGFRAHLQFPSTKWELLAGASPRGEQSTAALNEFANRYYAAVRAFIAAVYPPIARLVSAAAFKSHRRP